MILSLKVSAQATRVPHLLYFDIEISESKMEIEQLKREVETISSRLGKTQDYL